MDFKRIEQIMEGYDIEDYISCYEYAFPDGDTTKFYKRSNIENIEEFIDQYIILAQLLAGANVPHFSLGSFDECWHRESVMTVRSFAWIGWWKLTLLRSYREGSYKDQESYEDDVFIS